MIIQARGRKFAEGDRFDVTRTIDHHMAFGCGLHFFLAAALARLEGRVALDDVERPRIDTTRRPGGRA